MLGSSMLGHYAVAVSLGELLVQIPRMIGSVLFPIVASASDQSRAARHTIRYAKITGVVACVISLVCFVSARLIIRVAFGKAYDESVLAFQCLLPGMIFLSMVALMNNHLSGTGYPVSLIIAHLSGLAVNIVLNCWWLPWFGIAGASVATCISYGIQLLVNWYSIRLLIRSKDDRNHAGA
jgi:O-antigen/teichoic acid export membrane protein